jgi:hypothetical protein
MDYLGYIRQFKIGPFAIFDSVLAFLGIFLLSPLLTKLFLKMHLNITLSSWMWLTLPLSVVFHVLFRQNTALMKIIFGSNHLYSFIAIATLLFMTYMGLKNVKNF